MDADVDFTLKIHIEPDGVDEDAPPTHEFERMEVQNLISTEQRIARRIRGKKLIAWAQRKLVELGFGLPEDR